MIKNGVFRLFYCSINVSIMLIYTQNEDTHVTKPQHVVNLLILTTIAFIWEIKAGEWLIQNRATIPIKKL